MGYKSHCFPELMSNGLISSVLKQVRRPKDLRFLHAVNQVSDMHDTIGLIGAAQLVNKTLQVKDVTLVEQRLVNTLVPKLVSNASLLPANLAVSFFNSLVSINDPRARIVLAGIQDRWFEGWREPALEKSTKRPKKKLEISGLYNVDTSCTNNSKVPRFQFIESVDDDTLEEAVHLIATTHASDHRSIAYIRLVVRAFLQEYRTRLERSGRDMPATVFEFIAQLEQNP